MKKLGLLMLAVLMISLSSCGGDDAKKENSSEAKTEVKQEATKPAEAAKPAEAVKEEAKDQAAAGANGADVFKKSACNGCHQLDKKVGSFPAVKEIAAAYAGKKDDLVKFLKGEGKAIVDAANFNQMKPNIETTKKLSDADLNALVDYILSVK